MFYWDDEATELTCTCGRLVSDMEIHISGKMDIEFDEFDRVKDNTVIYIPTFANYHIQKLVCKCGKQWKIELWDEIDEPLLQFNKQSDGTFKPYSN